MPLNNFFMFMKLSSYNLTNNQLIAMPEGKKEHISCSFLYFNFNFRIVDFALKCRILIFFEATTISTKLDEKYRIS